MPIDARSLPDGTRLEADLCVIGAGAAGITIARELAPLGSRIVLLESGGFEADLETQRLYEGATGGTFLPDDGGYLVSTRLRYFGGTTNHWQGECRPLDAIDFEARDWVPESGWPFPRADLDPFYARAAAVVECAPFPYDLAARSRARGPLLVPDQDQIATTFFHKSPPTRFGAAYRQELLAAPSLTVVLRAHALAVERDPLADRVGSVLAAADGGRQLRVQARLFVLATGAIENARLLLVSNQVQGAGLGNQNDLVGRFFMEHPLRQVGHLVLPGRKAAMRLYGSYAERPGGKRVVGAMRLGDGAQRERRLLNLSLLVAGPRRDEAPPLGREVGAVAAALDPPVDPGRTGGGDYLARVEMVCENRPRPDSRVTLDGERDRLGLPRVRLEWRVGEEEERTFREAAMVLARELGRQGLGRASFRVLPEHPWQGFTWAAHHMGTTRMAASPRQGVTDPEGRVHGLANLYVAGSSLFPTSGCSNPTLTLVALALRLADRLKRLLAG